MAAFVNTLHLYDAALAVDPFYEWGCRRRPTSNISDLPPRPRDVLGPAKWMGGSEGASRRPRMALSATGDPGLESGEPPWREGGALCFSFIYSVYFLAVVKNFLL